MSINVYLCVNKKKLKKWKTSGSLNKRTVQAAVQKGPYVYQTLRGSGGDNEKHFHSTTRECKIGKALHVHTTRSVLHKYGKFTY